MNLTNQREDSRPILQAKHNIDKSKPLAFFGKDVLKQLTLTVSHTIKEKPLVGIWAVAGKTHIMTCFNAENCKELHFLTWDGLWKRAKVGKLLRQIQWTGLVVPSSPVLVNL